MKKCSRCKEEKEEIDLICYSKTKSGQYYHCLDCNAERARKYRKTETGRNSINNATRKSIEKHKEKQNARELVVASLRRGVLLRPKKCSECPSRNCKIEAHHDNYSKPLEVRWLCKNCHRIFHRENKSGN